MIDPEMHRTIRELANELNRKYMEIRKERDRLGLKPGDKLIDLRGWDDGIRNVDDLPWNGESFDYDERSMTL